MESTGTKSPSTTPAADDDNLKQYCVTFLHLDLGIGGAEQLVLQLAHASRDAGCGCDLELWTTRCDANHCFASVRPGSTGVLYPHLRVYGRWIPADILGIGRALCSTLRLWYLTARWIYEKGRDSHQIVVVDVLPTPLPLLRYFTKAHLLFYCHFPDQLLTRSKETSKTRDLYRRLLNWMEDSTMPFADTICVNSQFTRTVVQETFPSLRSIELPVLYPALDASSLDATTTTTDKASIRPIVSLNRYERKKNLELVLDTAQWIQKHHPEIQIPPIIIAGGYDVHNVENVEYRGELGQRVEEYGLQDVVTFRQSISDQERKELLHTGLCVVYTPSNEHFGIVPLEAMYCQTPVLACNSGGPKESIVDGSTGFLRAPTAQAFGQALLTWIRNPSMAMEMGKAGRTHVQERFGFAPRLVEEWRTLLAATTQRGTMRQRQQDTYRVGHAVVYVVEASLILVALVLLTYILRHARILEEDESVLGGIKRGFQREEL